MELKLSRLREQYPSQQDQADIHLFETELTTLTGEKVDLALPLFKRFATLALKKTNDLNALLMNDETLLNDRGVIVARERGLWRAMLTAFDPKARDSAIEALESLIDEKLTS